MERTLSLNSMGDTAGMRCLELKDLPKVPMILDGISSSFLRENKIIPIELRDNTFEVVMANPGDRAVVEALKVAAGASLVICTADERTIDDYISRFYLQEPQNISRIIEEIDEGGSAVDLVGEDGEDIDYLKDLASEAPIIKLVNMFMLRAVESRASDIHVEPFEDEMKVRFRVDGVLHDIEALPKRLQPAVVSRIKLIAKLNIAERRLPQDGRIRLKVSEKEIDLRISTVPVLYGESIVIRLLPKEGILMELEGLGFDGGVLSAFNGLIARPNGIVLVTGPTGSGKTTTLYAALNKINSPEEKIITVEDPIEYHLKGINQIQVKPQIGLNFATTIRHIVRQDPDIIMVGEIRDLETAEIAMQAALTGHLVFSTLHTNDSASSITRLLDMKVESFLLASTIRGILAQRLVRAICPSCKTSDTSLGGVEKLMSLGFGGERPTALYAGRGCEECAFTGYYGRVGIFELLVVDDEIQRMIMKNYETNAIRNYARKHGMKKLLEDGVEKVKSGTTTLDEVLRVTQEA
jgi:general secretion pathway protein E